MYRVTSNMMKNDLIYNIHNHLQSMDEMHNQLSTGKKVRVPHEDVVSATHSMIYRSRINQIQQYIKNIDEGKERLTITDSSLQSVNDILKRFKELAVQGANGIYTDADRAKIAVEVDELTKQLVQIANTKYKGESVFGGHRTDISPFQVVKGRPNYADREVITEVRYRGNIGEQNREIEQSEYVPVNLPGDKAFWTTNQVITSGVNVTAYTAPANAQIKIDGKTIDIAAGDNINTIISKINNANVPVYASLTGFNNNSLQITTTAPHELWMEDIGNSTILQDLGLADRNMKPNQAPGVGTSRKGMSLFDMAIQLRDDLWKGDVKNLGSRDIAMIDASQDNILKNLAEVGARTHRLDAVKNRLTQDNTSMMDVLAKTENIDFPETIMNLKMMEYIHQSSLASGAKAIKPTLIDFLR